MISKLLARAIECNGRFFSRSFKKRGRMFFLIAICLPYFDILRDNLWYIKCVHATCLNQWYIMYFSKSYCFNCYGLVL